ncbi:hypothetical protein TFLX_06589 [Thermoflexales bacterium]|nr:hypothetical protein TFLX_06589 [Thermoflexales bacterium]
MIQRSAFLVFVVVFLLALLLYASTAASSLTWAHSGADGGDLITAAVTNGVPHPPGYPTYVTFGRLIAHIPIGDVAYRFNLFSAVCMAVAAGLTSLSIATFVARGVRLITILASLFFVTAPMVWGQATIAEVHALNACLVALCGYLVAPIVFRCEIISLGRLTLAAWLWGMAFGNSITVVALTPLMIVAWRRHPRRSPWPICALLLGLGIYALIPLRAIQQPPVNWGAATSFDRFVALTTAEMYRGYALGAPPAELFTRLIAFAQLIVTQYGWFGVILSGVGTYQALTSSNKNWRWLTTTIALYLIFALSYSAADSALYLIPVWMFGTWAIARGLMAVIEWLTLRSCPYPCLRQGGPLTQCVADAWRRVRRGASFMPAPPLDEDRAGRVAHLSSLALIAVFLLGPALNVLIHFPAMNLRNDRAATEFASTILTAAPPGAIVVTENDGHTFALWYHRHVAGQRPDLAVIDRRLAGYSWYDVMLHAQGSAPLLPEYDPLERWNDRLAQLNPQRAVCIVDRASAQMTCRR